MTEYSTKTLPATLARIASNALRGAASGARPAGTVLIEHQAGSGAIFAVNKAAEQLKLSGITLQVTPDLRIPDIAALSFDLKNSELVLRTIFDRNREKGGILLIEEAERFDDATAKALAHILDGDVSDVPALKDIDFGKWFIILATRSGGSGGEHQLQLHPDLAAKAMTKIRVTGNGQYTMSFNAPAMKRASNANTGAATQFATTALPDVIGGAPQTNNGIGKNAAIQLQAAASKPLAP